VARADDSGDLARRILVGVAELRGRFGGGHVADVLAGASTERIRTSQHDRLTCYGSLREASRQELRAWIDQLVAQGLLARTGDEYPTLKLTPAGARVIRGESVAGPLSRAARAAPTRRIGAPAAGALPAPDEAALFESLRRVRRALAEERHVPPYVIFSDVSLREMARLRPLTPRAFREIKGVGDWKCEAFGAQFMAAIRGNVINLED
jgi:ATP-dependent DNA helicase RecQ